MTIEGQSRIHVLALNNSIMTTLTPAARVQLLEREERKEAARVKLYANSERTSTLASR